MLLINLMLFLNFQKCFDEDIITKFIMKLVLN
jgi:hypothetical protein